MASKRPRKGIMDYDFQNDIFYSRPVRRSYEYSEQIGDFVIDFDKIGKIIGLEVFNASTYFDKPKIFLKNVFSHSVKIEISEKYISIRIGVLSKQRNKEVDSLLNLEKINEFALEPNSLTLEA
ncbi:MAG: DUF2283 domain-containing protein [Candidatus Woesearchaeota archaeon]